MKWTNKVLQNKIFNRLKWYYQDSSEKYRELQKYFQMIKPDMAKAFSSWIEENFQIISSKCLISSRQFYTRCGCNIKHTVEYFIFSTLLHCFYSHGETQIAPACYQLYNGIYAPINQYKNNSSKNHNMTTNTMPWYD